jgi:hypothetical protein
MKTRAISTTISIAVLAAMFWNALQDVFLHDDESIAPTWSLADYESRTPATDFDAIESGVLQNATGFSHYQILPTALSI